VSGRVLLATAGLALASSGVAYIVYYWLLATLHATQAAIVTYLIPLAALFWGWLVLDESIGLGAVPGLVLIVIGVYLVSVPRARARERENAPEGPGRSRAVG
jgi:drug/metabolite transporter (DMT)-like permease